MTDTFKATPEQWQASERRAANGHSNDLRFLELRARVEALEAQAGNYPAIPDSSTPPFVGPVATDEELAKTWNTSYVGDSAFNVANRALYNLGIKHGQASSREMAAPAPVAGGLVERVKLDIDSARYDEDDHQWNEGRAAILEVAKWMREQGWVIDADILEQEAGR
jgi:hypothetical protein